MIDRPNSDTVYLNCPRCGLSIRRRIEWLTVEYCPRCIGRARIPVGLFTSNRPAGERQGHRLAARSPRRDEARARARAR